MQKRINLFDEVSITMSRIRAIGGIHHKIPFRFIGVIIILPPNRGGSKESFL